MHHNRSPSTAHSVPLLWWLSILCSAGLAILIYLPGLSGGWLLDDYGNIVNNGALNMRALDWSSLIHAALSYDAGPLRRPISMITFALNRYAAGGLNVEAFKATNLALHVLTFFALLFFTRALLRSHTRIRRNTSPGIREDWTALAVCAIWAVHPVNLTPVLYVVQRETILATFFTALGLWFFTHVRANMWAGKSRGHLLLPGLLFFSGLAAFSKESGALLPLFAFLIEVMIFRFHVEKRSRYTLPIVYLFALFIPAAIGLYWTFPGIVHGYAGRPFSLGERLLTEPRVLFFYLSLIFAPRLAAFSLYHDDIAISTGIVSPPDTLLAILGIVALLLIAWKLRYKRPLIALGIVWFFAAQAMTATVYPLEIAFEHRVYLADWGILLATVSFLSQLNLARYLRFSNAKPVLTCLLIAALALATAARAHEWRSDLALAKSEAAHHPESPRATYLLARIYTNRALDGNHGDIPKALAASLAAAHVPNSGLDPWVALVLLAAQTGRHIQGEWFDGMAKAVKHRPLSVSDVDALEALVRCTEHHQCHIPRKRMKQLFTAVYNSPHLKRLPMHYANVLVTQANYIGYATPEDQRKALGKLQKAAQLMPNVAQYHVNVFNVALDLGDPKLAKAELQKIRHLNRFGHLTVTIQQLETRLHAHQRAAHGQKH